MTDLRRPPKLFGSARRTELLLMLALLGETYPAELTRLLGATKASVLQILRTLESEGIVASRPLGRTRRIALDPRYFGAKELEALLGKLASGRPELKRLAAGRRARPRRPGKPL